MRILIATDSFAPKIDGVADTTAIVARMLAGRGHDVRVIAPGPGDARIDGYRVARIRSAPCPFYPELRMTLPFGAVRRLIGRRPPDAAVVLTPGPIGVAVVAALPAGVPIVNVYTTDIPHYLRSYRLGVLRSPVAAVLRWMSRRAVVTLCPTELVRSELAARGHECLDVWGRGADLELFHPARRSAEVRRRLTGGEVAKPLILYVGRLAREKRLLDLLEAARRLPDLRFALVGDGPQRDLLERRFAAVPSVFTGYLRGKQLAAAFASADVFAFPSTSETFGQVVLQAMASGVPPVVVEGTAPAEFVPHGMAGLHVRPRDPASLAGALALLTSDDEVRQRMSRAAVEVARSHSWSALIDRLEAMLAPRPALAAAGR